MCNTKKKKCRDCIVVRVGLIRKIIILYYVYIENYTLDIEHPKMNQHVNGDKERELNES